jgi:simple sugar transport system permease protein
MIRSENRSLFNSLMVPTLSILLGFLLGAIIMLAFGYNPILAYTALFQGVFGDLYFFGETLRQASVLTFTGLGFAIAFQAGFFNIGIAGQALLGWVVAIGIGLLFPGIPPMLLMLLCLAGGLLAGALWSAIAGTLRAYFGTNEVIVTIMLNYTAFHMTNYIIRTVLTDGANNTDRVAESINLRMNWLTQLTNNSRINAGLFLALIAVVLYWIFLNKTTAGFEIRSVGLNAHASKYAGMSAEKNIILSMFISGALAGLGGAIQGLGTFQNIFVQSHLPGFGFDGIAVALLGLGNPFGIFLSSFLFGLLDVGSGFLPNRAGVPNEIADIVTASIIFFIGANYIIRYVLNRKQTKEVDATQGGDTE